MQQNDSLADGCISQCLLVPSLPYIDLLRAVARDPAGVLALLDKPVEPAASATAHQRANGGEEVERKKVEGKREREKVSEKNGKNGENKNGLVFGGVQRKAEN